MLPCDAALIASEAASFTGGITSFRQQDRPAQTLAKNMSLMHYEVVFDLSRAAISTCDSLPIRVPDRDQQRPTAHSCFFL
jgi:hypothetical protein